MRHQPILAGVVAALVGFASSFAVILAGLRAVGASEAEAASGLTILLLTMAAAAIFLGVRSRIPISVAWSTPGAALLATAAVPDGGFAAAVGAFLVCGVLLAIAGTWGLLARAIAAIPVPIASAMLAGVLLPLCVAPVEAVVDVPLLAGPTVVTWLVLWRFARPYAVPGALIAAVVAIVVDGSAAGLSLSDASPTLTVVAPVFDAGAIVGIAIPLFIVTMASQNIPGMAVLHGFGYRPRLRPILVTTGVATAAGAPFGGHAINLAAITAALVAGPEAGPDPRRRWIASVTAGFMYIGLGLAAGLATAFVVASPPILIEAVAGLALLGALGGALSAALAAGEDRDAAVVTFVVAASGVAAAGIGAAFWALVAGLAFRAVARAAAPPPATVAADAGG